MQDSKTLQPKLDSELWEEPKYDELKMFEPILFLLQSFYS